MEYSDCSSHLSFKDGYARISCSEVDADDLVSSCIDGGCTAICIASEIDQELFTFFVSSSQSLDSPKLLASSCTTFKTPSSLQCIQSSE